MQVYITCYSPKYNEYKEMTINLQSETWPLPLTDIQKIKQSMLECGGAYTVLLNIIPLAPKVLKTVPCYNKASKDFNNVHVLSR